MRATYSVLACLVVAMEAFPAHSVHLQVSALDSGSKLPQRPLSRDEWDPVPATEAVVVASKAVQFTILTDRMVRVQRAPQTGGLRNDPSFAIVNRRIPVPHFTSSLDPSSAILTIQTKYLTLTYDTKAQGPLSESNLNIAFKNGKFDAWTPASDPAIGNLHGTVRTLDTYRTAPNLDCKLLNNDGQHCHYGLISRNGWAIIDDTDTPRLETTSHGNVRFPWVKADPNTASNDGVADWYFLGYGHDYKAALFDFTLISGKIPIPPRFAFGSWSSRYWAYNDVEFLALADMYAENNIPLDVMVIDMDWHKTYYSRPGDRGGDGGGLWTGYTWDPSLFADARGFLETLKSSGLRTTVNLHPANGIMPHEDVFLEMSRRLGYDPSRNFTIPFQSSNATFMAEYLGYVINSIEEDGIDFFWLDWQQGESWQDWTKIKNLNPTIWLNYVFWHHAKTHKRKGDIQRPLNFHRWGGLGNHRYPIGFSGDTWPNWEMLDTQIAFTVTASNVLFGYWSHDIGAHMEQPATTELYLRWVQFGCWSPIFRTHSTKQGHNLRYFWNYPRPESDLMRAALQERMALLPYSYSMAKVAYDSGVSIMRPLYYEFGEDDDAYAFPSQYYYGDNFLVRPIAIPAGSNGITELIMWVPRGIWLEPRTGRIVRGPARHTGYYTLADVPILLKTPSITPRTPSRYTAAGFSNPASRNIILDIALEANHVDETVVFHMHEDDGVTPHYADTAYTLATRIEVRVLAGRRVHVLVQPQLGDKSGMHGPRRWTLEFRNRFHVVVARVRAGDAWSDTRVRYNIKQMSAVVEVGEFEMGEELQVEVEFAEGDTGILEAGLLGKLARAGQVKKMLDDWFDKLKPPVYQDHYASLLQSLTIAQSVVYNATNSVMALTDASQLFDVGVEEVKAIVAIHPQLQPILDTLILF